MSDLNHVVITGCLVRDPSISGNGSKSAFFRIAANRRYRTKTDSKQQETAYLNCKAFGGWADALVDGKQGNMVLVEGRLRTEEWASDAGTVRLELVLVVNSIRFMNCGVPVRPPTPESNEALVNAGAPLGETAPSDEVPF